MRRTDEKIAAYESALRVLQGEVRRLQKMNEDLLNRVMSSNYQEYKMFNNDVFAEAALKAELAPDSDPDNAGEIYYEDEEKYEA